MGFGRLGITVGRRIGSAVVRNRIKRIVREAFRGAPDVRAFGADFIVVVRNAGAIVSMMGVRAEIERRALQMASRRWIQVNEKDAAPRHRDV